MARAETSPSQKTHLRPPVQCTNNISWRRSSARHVPRVPACHQDRGLEVPVPCVASRVQGGLALTDSCVDSTPTLLVAPKFETQRRGRLHEPACADLRLPWKRVFRFGLLLHDGVAFEH